MRIEFKDNAKEDLRGFDAQLKLFFKQHIDKLASMPLRKKHLKFGIPFHKEDVTKQARLIDDLSEDVFYVVRCFATHKEYEKWYKSYKS